MGDLPEGPAQLPPETLRAHRILIVDDEASNLDLLRRSLSAEFDVLTASSGYDALTILDERPASVLVSDHMMPGLTGIDVCEEVARSHPDVERIILTAYEE